MEQSKPSNAIPVDTVQMEASTVCCPLVQFSPVQSQVSLCQQYWLMLTMMTASNAGLVGSGNEISQTLTQKRGPPRVDN